MGLSSGRGDTWDLVVGGFSSSLTFSASSFFSSLSIKYWKGFIQFFVYFLVYASVNWSEKPLSFSEIDIYEFRKVLECFDKVEWQTLYASLQLNLRK